MKSPFLSIVSVLMVASAIAQNSPSYPTTGSLGLGIATPASGYQLQVHGVGGYISPSTQYMEPDGGYTLTVPGSTLGTTARIGFTNPITGTAATDGTILRQTGSAFVAQNLERGLFSLQSNRALITLDGYYNRISIGAQAQYSSYSDAALNINQLSDNGLKVVSGVGKYGLSITAASNDYAALFYSILSPSLPTLSIKSSGITELYYRSAGGTTTNLFTIRNNDRKLLQLSNDGILRSREIIVDALTWADYVFEPAYDLMSLDELNAYISENKHLPNVPSTVEVEQNGVNLAKTDAILLEKIEELTLYLLQQDAKMKAMQLEIETLKKSQSEK